MDLKDPDSTGLSGPVGKSLKNQGLWPGPAIDWRGWECYKSLLEQLPGDGHALDPRRRARRALRGAHPRSPDLRGVESEGSAGEASGDPAGGRRSPRPGDGEP